MSRFDDLAETLVDGRNYSFASWWVCVWRTELTLHGIVGGHGMVILESCAVMLLFYVLCFKF
jgi:hypothetical protein